MARYRRYRKYSRRRHIWSSRITNLSGSQSAGAGQQFVIYYNLCQNPAQTNTTISQKYTVKNVHLQLNFNNDTTSTNQTLKNFQAFICYIPQGYVPTGVPGQYADVPYDHPEWIMAHRYLGTPGSNTSSGWNSTFTLRSRLARKLDTGDRVVVIILGNNTSTASYTVNYSGVVKYVTKSN